MSDVLVVLKDARTMGILSNLLKTEGYSVQGARTREDGEACLAEKTYRLLILGLDKPEEDDALIGLIQEKSITTPIILLAERAAALKITRLARVFHAISLPLKIDTLLAQVQKAIDFKAVPTQDVINLNFQLESVHQVKGLVAESPAMKSICDLIGRVSATDVPILIIGEKSTGKERIAGVIHSGSRRKDKPFMVLDGDQSKTVAAFQANQAAFFDQLTGGTLFLQRPESLPEKMRVDLKEILHTRTVAKSNGERPAVDFRLITGTNTDLDAECAQGRFDADLLRLIRVIVLRVPPLRDRRKDIVPLLRDVLQGDAGKDDMLPGITRDAVAALEGYSWPGNLTEFEEVVHYAAQHAVDGQIRVGSFPPTFRRSGKPTQ